MSTSAPLVSVVMPVYNCEQYVQRSVSAVLNQRFRDFEFIIINDGSTDRTKELLQAFTDQRIRYFENDENYGVVRTLNRGIDLARGKYIMRTDADDVSYLDMIGSLVDYMECDPECILCGSYVRILGTKKIVPKPSIDAKVKIYTLLSCPFPHTCIMIRKQVLFDRNLRYDLQYLDGEDHGLWSELLPYGKFHNLKKVLIDYNKSNPDQVTARPVHKENYFRFRRRMHLFHGKRYFNLSHAEAEIYWRLIRSEKAGSIDALDETRRLLAKIMMENLKNGFFHQGLLKKFLLFRWYYVCLNSYELGARTFFSYVKGIKTTQQYFNILAILSLLAQGRKLIGLFGPDAFYRACRRHLQTLKGNKQECRYKR